MQYCQDVQNLLEHHALCQPLSLLGTPGVGIISEGEWATLADSPPVYGDADTRTDPRRIAPVPLAGFLCTCEVAFRAQLLLYSVSADHSRGLHRACNI